MTGLTMVTGISVRVFPRGRLYKGRGGRQWVSAHWIHSVAKEKDPDATSGKKLELAIKVVELIDDVVKLSALKRRQLTRD